MAWFILARVLFTAAVAYTAFLLRPLGPEPVVNVGFGFVLAAVAVFFEWRLRDLALTSILGALLGGGIGAAVRQLGWLGCRHQQPDSAGQG